MQKLDPEGVEHARGLPPDGGHTKPDSSIFEDRVVLYAVLFVVGVIIAYCISFGYVERTFETLLYCVGRNG